MYGWLCCTRVSKLSQIEHIAVKHKADTYRKYLTHFISLSLGPDRNQSIQWQCLYLKFTPIKIYDATWDPRIHVIIHNHTTHFSQKQRNILQYIIININILRRNSITLLLTSIYYVKFLAYYGAKDNKNFIPGGAEEVVALCLASWTSPVYRFSVVDLVDGVVVFCFPQGIGLVGPEWYSFWEARAVFFALY